MIQALLERLQLLQHLRAGVPACKCRSYLCVYPVLGDCEGGALQQVLGLARLCLSASSFLSSCGLGCLRSNEGVTSVQSSNHGDMLEPMPGFKEELELDSALLQRLWPDQPVG